MCWNVCLIMWQSQLFTEIRFFLNVCQQYVQETCIVPLSSHAQFSIDHIPQQGFCICPKVCHIFPFLQDFDFLTAHYPDPTSLWSNKNAQLSVFESVKLKDKNCINYTINRNCNLAFSSVSFINWDSN